MKPGDLFQTGHLKDAIDAAVAACKADPQDPNPRNLLVQFLCFSGDYERADKQLDVLAGISPAAAITCSMLRNIIRCAIARREVFTQKKIPENFEFEKDREDLQLRLKALLAFQEGNLAESKELVDQAEALRKPVSGTFNGAAFEDFRDLDDLTASFLEVFATNGKYYWIALDQLEKLELQPRKEPLDLLWRRARMVIRNGPDGEVYIPALYAGAETSPDQKVQLGRLTDWVGEEGAPIRGLGLRTFLIGEADHPIHDIEKIEFNAPPEPPAS